MNEMQELQFARQVRLRLNRGLHEIPAGPSERLRAARERALGQQRVAVHQSALASVGNYLHSHFDRLHVEQLVAALVLALGIGFAAYWHADQSLTDLEEIDSALLADELPVGALTDKGFDAWLKNSSAQ